MQVFYLYSNLLFFGCLSVRVVVAMKRVGAGDVFVPAWIEVQ
jgi:hypothetical protein